MLSIEERIRNYEPFFGKWLLDDPPQILGRGNSGIVYLVHADEVDAALKIISIPRDQSQLDSMLEECGGSMERVKARIDQELKYAQTEIEIMERLKSDSHIVCFEESYIYTRQDTYGYDVIIRMERLVRLDAFLKAPEKYRIFKGKGLTLRIWSELVSGLCFCERCGIVHLDVKPENIFYAEPSRDYFKLGDFGVSIRSENGRFVSAGMIVGTLDYMAPEIYEGRGGDARSDIYSLALVIYSMFNNDRLPFLPASGRPTDDDFAAARKKRLEGGREIPPIKGLDPTLSGILMRCLKRNPDDRYPSMAALYVDLEKYRLQKIDNVTKPSRRSKLVPIIAAAGAVGVLGFFGVRFLLNGHVPQASVERGFKFKEGSNLISMADLGEDRSLKYAITLDKAAEVKVIVNRALQGEYYADGKVPMGIVLDPDNLKRDELNDVQFRIGETTVFSDAFVFDDRAELSLDTPESGFFITNQSYTGRAEPNAVVRLVDASGKEILRAQPDENGAFTFNLDGGRANPEDALSAGRYALEIEDEAGNITRQDLDFTLPPVEPRRHAAISVDIDSADGAISFDKDTNEMRVWGDERECGIRISGEPEAELTITRAGTGDVMDTTIGEDGDVIVNLQIPEGETTYSVGYADQSSDPVEWRVMADYTPPQIRVVESPAMFEEAALTVLLSESVTDVVVRGEEGTVVSTGEVDDGEWTFEERVYDGREYTVVAHDAFGNEGKTSFSPNMSVAVDPVDDFSKQVVVHTAPGALVTLMVDGERLDPVEAGDDGTAVVDLPEALWVGETVEVLSQKNREEASLSLDVRRRPLDEPIKIRVVPADDEGPLRIEGTALAEAKVSAFWNGSIRECGQAEVGEDGAFTIIPSTEAVGLPLEGQTGVFRVCYTYGFEEEPQAESGKVTWDASTFLNIDPLSENSEVLSGTAEKGASVEVRDENGTVRDYFTADEETGAFSWLPDGPFAVGTRYLLKSTDPHGNSAEAEAVVKLALQVEQVYSDSGIMVIHATPMSTVRIRRGEELLAELQVGEDRSAIWGPGTAFTEGEVYAVTATDAAGNESDPVEARVSAETRPSISEVTVNGQSSDALEGYTAVGSPLQISGFAAANSCVNIYWSDGIQTWVVANEDGWFNAELNAGATNPAGEPRPLRLSYSDGGQLRETAPFAWWRLEVEQLYADSGFMIIHAAPALTVRILRGEELMAELQTWEDGNVIWSPGSSFTGGEVYTVTAIDAVGNELTTFEVSVSGDTRAWIDGITVNDQPLEALEGYTAVGNPLRIGGHASASTWVNIYWNDAIQTWVPTDENGWFYAELSADALNASGEGASLRLSYNDGGETQWTPGFAWDGKTWVSADTVYSDEAQMTLHTDPWAWVHIRRGEEDLADVQAGEDGTAVWVLPEGWAFTGGEVYTATATDPAGNAAAADVPVTGVIPRAEIGAWIEGTEYNEGLNANVLRGWDVVVSGTAEPNTQLRLAWNGQEAYVDVNAEGTYSQWLFNGEVGIPKEGSDWWIEISYADGCSPRQNSGVGFRWDTWTGLEVEQVYADSGRMIIHTDPWAWVHIARGEEALADIQAGEDGTAVWMPPEGWVFTGGEVYAVTATDPVGNAAVLEVSVSGDTRAWIDGITVNDQPLEALEGYTAVGNPLRIGGHASASTWVNIYWNDAIQTWVPTDENGWFYAELSADALNASGEGASLRLSYNDGGETQWTPGFAWDGKTWVSADTVYSDEAQMTLHTDPWAWVHIRRGEEDLADVQAGEDGTAVWVLPEGWAFTGGEVYTATATDPAGNAAAADVPVTGVIPRAEIGAWIEGTEYNEGLNANVLRGWDVVVSGTAEPNTQLRLAWNGQEAYVDVNAEGTYSQWLFNGEVGIPKEGSDWWIEISYADGCSPRQNSGVGFRWDTWTGLEVEQVYADSGRMIIHTDPWAWVHIARGEEALADIQAGEDGTAVWMPPEGWVFTGGEVYAVKSTDPVGNAAVLEVSVSGDTRAWIDGITVNDQPLEALEGYTAVGSPLRIGGHASASACVNIYWNDAIQTWVPTDENGWFYAELSADALNASGEGASLRLSYNDGGETQWTPGFAWDGKTWVSADTVYSDEAQMTLHTDPWAWVHIRRGEEDLADVQAGEDGTAVWVLPEGWAFTGGEVYTATATDPSGNMAAADIVVESAPSAESQDQQPDAE